MRRLLLLVSCFAALAANARVVSYAPYTSRNAYPAVQSRTNRHFVLYETPSTYFTPGQLVLYDSQGVEEPRIVYPTDGTMTGISSAAVREETSGLAILALTEKTWILSADGGSTWKNVALPLANASSTLFSYDRDTGGPFTHARHSALRVATHDWPFVYLYDDPTGGGSALYAVGIDGRTKTLFTSADNNLKLSGTSIDGNQYLLVSRQAIVIVGIDGTFRSVPMLQVLPQLADGAEGWLTQTGQIYLEMTNQRAATGLYFFDGFKWSWVDGQDGSQIGAVDLPTPPPPPQTDALFFAVPSSDYAGAWSINRTTASTRLSFSRNGSQAVKQWEDVPPTEVEALHPSKSGDKVLIQVHRPRQTLDLITFKDPALAVWHVGDPTPPRAYDELFLEEQYGKGFVHLDVDRVESGDPFVFDSGVPQVNGGTIVSPPPPTAGGGSDVAQEWGVVRASLAQRLVLPGAARTAGAFGSYWLTDVTFYNPSTSSVNVVVRYVANGDAVAAETAPTRTVTLAPREIRTIADVLKNLFEFESGGGALFITPDTGASVNVTSRTYTTASHGTFGFGMNAIDIYAAASPRFPVTFAGAFLGSNFRTNLVVTDVSGRGSDTALQAWGGGSMIAQSTVPFHSPALGQQQFNAISNSLGLRSTDTGSLIVQPSSGEAVASLFAIDNRTNDATYFPPDIAASVVRVIPAIGHLDGANGAKFRTDLYLFNNGDTVQTLTLQVHVWDDAQTPTAIPFTLLPHESRIIPDVLFTMFGKSGIARLRFWQQGAISDTSVRVTARTYTIDSDGGTYGFLMPPLNSFQSGSAGDTLEILGTSLDAATRTNLGLVDLTPWYGPPSKAHVDLIDDKGNVADGFDVSVNAANGTQINDLYRARSLAAAATPMLIRVTVISGYIGAYAAVVDNGTNDPAYFAANLAAKN